MSFKVLSEWLVVYLFAYIPPLNHLDDGYEVFPVKPPWYSTKIYPFLDFDSPIESNQNQLSQ